MPEKAQKPKRKKNGKWDSSEKARRIRAIDPFGDYDRDSVINLMDCQPFNPLEHGLLGDTKTFIMSRVIRPTYQRAQPYVSAYAQRVSMGVSTAGATAQRYTQQYAQRYKPTVSYDRAAERRRAAIEAIKRKKRRALERMPSKRKIAGTIKRPPVMRIYRDSSIVSKPISFTGTPGQMGLLMGAKATLPFWRYTVEKAKDVTGYSSWQQRKVMEKESSDVQSLESDYIKKGWIKTVHPSERSPENIGTITGVYTEPGFARPSPQLPMMFVGSKEYQAQVDKVEALDANITPHLKGDAYTSPAVASFYDKWEGQISGKYFMGSDAEYQQFQREGKAAMGKEKQTVDTYNAAIDALNALQITRGERYDALTQEYTEYDIAQKEHERLHELSVFGAYGRSEARASKWIMARTPDIDLTAVMMDKKDYKAHPLPFEYHAPFAGFGEVSPESDLGRYYTGVAQGHYTEIRTKPIKYASTTAIFAALPVGLKAGGGLLKAARITPSIAKIPYVGEKIVKYALPAVGGGLMSLYAGSAAYEIHKAPTPYEKGYITGRMMLELEAMGVGTYAGVKIPGMLGGSLRGAKTRLTRTKVPPESIIAPEIITGKSQFPTLRGTEKQLIERFKTSERKYGLPGEQYGQGIKVWRAAGEQYGAETTVGRGDYSFPSMYVAPEASAYFWRIKPEVKWSLFGFDPATPVPAATSTAYRLAIKDIIKIPKGVQKTDLYAPRISGKRIFPSEASWALGRTTPGRAYITPEYVYGKGEAEAGIAVTTGLQRTGAQFYTTWKGKAIPIEEMSWFKTGLPRMSVGFEKGRYYVRRPRGTAIISTKKGIILHKGEQGEGYILPGGETETAAVKALERGITGKAETALEGTMREVYEELGLKTIKSKYLFKAPGKDLSLYSKGRQHWYSKNIHSVFEIKTRGRMKLQTHEVKDLIYYKPGMDVKLSKDTEAILGKYFKTHTERTFKDVTGISKRVRDMTKNKPLKNIITQREILAEEQYIRGVHKRGFISPVSLGVEYGIGRIAGMRYGGKYGLPRYRYSGYEPSLLKYTPVDYGKSYKKGTYKTSYERKGRKYKTPKYKEPYYPKYRIPKYIEPYQKPRKDYYSGERYVKTYPRRYKDQYYLEEPYIPSYKKYYPLYYHPSYLPTPTIIPLPSKTKKIRRKKKHRYRERAWRERHFIPTLTDLMRMPKGSRVMTPEMPKLPKIIVPKI